MLAAIKRFIKLLSGAALAAAFLMFSVDNRQGVTFSLFPLPYSATMPLFLFAIACFTLGAVTGGTVTGLGSWQEKWRHREARRRVAALENEVKALHVQQEEKPPAISDK